MKQLISSVILVTAACMPFAAQAAKYNVIEVSNGGSISGKVTFSGTDPAPKVYAITKDQDTCGKGNREVDYVRVNNGALTNVVVYLDKVKEGKAFPNSGKGMGSLDQKGCEFHPFLQTMYNEKVLDVKNSDPVSHNIHTYEQIGKAKRTVLNLSQPKQNSVLKKKIKLRKGVGMKVECDQHDFMHGFIFVAKNPYFAVVGDDGTYKIEGIPAGKYTVKAWHGTLGNKKTSLDISAGGSATADFEYK